MKRYLFLLSVAIAVAMGGCSSPNTQVIYHRRDSEAGRQIANLDAIAKASQDKSFQDKARQTAMEFILHASAGEVEAMLRLTSPLTLKHTGKANVEQVYAQDIVPQFRRAVVDWNPGGMPQAEAGYPGFEVSGTARGGKNFPFYVYVFQERGRFVVGTLATTPKRE